MRILIIEDELHNARLLSGMIQKIRPDWEILDTLESVEESVEWITENGEPDLYFMDIQLTDGICFNIFEKVEIKNQVIFTTAYDEYALNAFKVNSIDYLLKPIKEEHLIKSIDKFEFLKQATSVPPFDLNAIIQTINQREAQYRKRFLVSKADSFIRLNVEDVAYFHFENRVTTAVTFTGQNHIVNFTIEKLEEELDPQLFFRANRSFILNAESIHSIENHFGGKLIVKLTQPLTEKIAVSRLKAGAIKEWLDR